MVWDPETARLQAVEFAKKLAVLEESAPEVVGEMRQMWKEAYLQSGHKILGRIMLGQEVDKACR